MPVRIKSDAISVEHREQGNELIKIGNYRDALISYNDALCFAKSNKNLALAYANRSVIYLHEKMYDECLINIQWAKVHEYPADKIQKLNEREEKCKKLKESHVKDPEEDPWNLFKLSYPSNPKIPFIVDCLEMRKTKKFGRGIYSTKDLKTGDIIAIEEGAVNTMYLSSEAWLYCCHCFTSNQLNLIPCTKTALCMFCSTECREKFYATFDNEKDLLDQNPDTMHQIQIYSAIEEKLGGREKLLEFLKENNIKKLNFSLFDFDWSDKNHPEYGRNQIKCFLSFDSLFDIAKEECPKVPYPNSPHFRNKQVVELLKHACGVNALIAKRVRLGSHGVLFGGLINHSCVPNVQRVQADNKFIYYVVKPIKAGEQLFESYHMFEQHINYYKMTLIPRQHLLTSQLGFSCGCIACKRDVSYKNLAKPQNSAGFNAFKAKIARYVIFDPLNTPTMKPALEHLKDYNEFIDENHQTELVSADVPMTINLYREFMSDIAMRATFPFAYIFHATSKDIDEIRFMTMMHS